jgi:hypothetical protein
MAQVKTETKTRLKTVEESYKVYNVTLTEDEAKAIVAVAANVGGTPNGPRGALDNVEGALAKALGTTWYLLKQEMKVEGSLFVSPVASAAAKPKPSFTKPSW